MTSYWIYEDLPTSKATVHRGDCRYCTNGTGRRGDRNEAENWWHGPYASVEQLKTAPRRANSALHPCGASPCRDDPALAALG